MMKSFIFTSILIFTLFTVIPSISDVYAGHKTIEETADICESEIIQSINNESFNPVILDQNLDYAINIVKDHVFEVAKECVKSYQHTLGNPCTIANDEEYILNQIQSLKDVGKIEHVEEMFDNLQINKWTCSVDFIDSEFNITKKINSAKITHDNIKQQQQIKNQKTIEHNKGRLVWDMDCSQKGQLIIKNVKEYSEDGITLNEIETYDYQILDAQHNVLDGDLRHVGEMSVSRQYFPEAKYVQLAGEQLLYETKEICSNYYTMNNFDAQLVCPSFSQYEVTEKYVSGTKDYSVDLKPNATFSLDIKNKPRIFNIFAYYSDGEIISKDKLLLFKVENSGELISHVVITSEDYFSKEIQYDCKATEAMENSLIKNYEYQLIVDEKIEFDNQYCTDAVSGCRAVYDIQYEINAPNDFFYKSWTESDNTDEIRNISYTFSKSSDHSFFSKETTNLKNGLSETYSMTEQFEFGSMFIPPKSPVLDLNTDENLEVKRTNMNFAGTNRDVIHIWVMTSDQTFLGFIDTEQNWYYDWETGLLLKSEYERTIVDVAGITNHEKIVKEVSKVNFPKNTSSGGGCLIATATYGSEMATEVQQLRELRDNSLLQTESGTNFMNIFNDVYYSFSPYIADYERENPAFKEMVKLAITPMISSLSILNHVDMNSESEVLGYGISLILLNVGMYLGVPVAVVVGIRKIK